MQLLEKSLLFKFRDARQERIYRRLKLVGAGPAEYFKDVCRLRETKPLFETTTHLIGHLIREIESSLRDVLSVFVESTERPTKDVHNWEIRQILYGIDMPEDHPIALLWLKNASSLAHRRAHRDNLQLPRPFDEDFERFVDEMESILDVVLSGFESKYLNVYAALDTKLSLVKPTKEDAKWVKKNVPHNEAALGYFFDRLNNPEWLAPLVSEGLFDRPPKPIYDPEKKSTFFPQWPLSRFLVRMAGLESEDVTESVGEILLGLESKNFMIHLDIAEAARLLPIELATQIAEKETTWLRAQRFIGHFLPNKFARLVAYLANGSSTDAALAIASAALGFVHGEDRELTAAETFFGPEPQTRMEHWDYGLFISYCWEQLANADWKASLELFCVLLETYLERKYPDMVEIAESHSYIWHRAIEHSETGLPNLLVSTVRQVAELAVSADGSRLDQVIKILESHRWDVFERIVLNILRLYPVGAEDTISERLLSEPSFRNKDYFHEYVLLLAASFRDLGEEGQRTVLGWIENCTASIEEVKRRKFEWDGTDLSDEDADKSIRFAKLKWLEPLRNVLPEDWKKKYDEWIAELGSPDHPTYLTGVPQAMWSAEPPASEFLSKFDTVEEIAAFLSEPTSELIESPQELSRELSQLVEADVNRFIPEANRFQRLAPIYVRGFLSGAGPSVQQLSESGLQKLLRFMASIIEQPAATANLSADKHPNHDSDHVQTRGVVGEIVSSILLNLKQNLPLSVRDEIWAIIRVLVDDLNASPESNENQEDADDFEPLTSSLNTIRGKAFHLLFRYLFWVREKQSITGGLESTREVREVLEHHLDLEVNRSLAVRAVYGEQLPFLISIDPDWVTEHLYEFLPIEEDWSDLRAAVWETFVIYTKPWDNVLDVLKGEYSRAIERLGTKSLYHSERSANHLAEHLVVFYARGRIGLNDGGLLDAFYARASDELAAHVFWFIGRILKEGDVPDEVLHRLALLVEHRITNGQEMSKEIEAFGWLVTSGKFDSEWGLLRLKEALQISPKSNPDGLVIETLSELALKFPRTVIECITLLVDGADTEWKIQYWSPRLRMAINSSLENGETDLARLLINKLAARGFVDFRDLLETG